MHPANLDVLIQNFDCTLSHPDTNDLEKLKEAGNSRDLDEIEEKEEIEEINETEEIQEEEIPPLDEGDYQDVDYKSMLEDTLKDL